MLQMAGWSAVEVKRKNERFGKFTPFGILHQRNPFFFFSLQTLGLHYQLTNYVQVT